jgi:hypothetical protein
MNLGEVINKIKIGQIAKATFAINQHCFITKDEAGFIRECNENGIIYKNEYPLMLTYSNLNAKYEFI